MAEQNMLFVCVFAFVAVFVLLGFLAAVMRLLMMVYPEKSPWPDANLASAITSAAEKAFPGTRVTKIEEVR